MNDFIREQIRKSFEIKQIIYEDSDLIDLIRTISQRAVKIYKNGGKTLIAGNGGSAADAQHIAGEFVSKFYFDRPGLPSLALTTDSSIMTAIGNDYGYDRLFARQLEANAVEGDMFIAISTSGNSPNILEALKVAREMKLVAVGLTGENGGKMAEMCDYCVKIPSPETPRIQESHILVGHIICSAVEEALFGEGFE